MTVASLDIGLASTAELPARVDAVRRLATALIERKNPDGAKPAGPGCDILAAVFERMRENELSMQRITDMIARQSPPATILEALAKGQDGDSERQTAFFLLQGDRWALAARSELTVQAAAALARIDPAALSSAFLAAEASATGRSERPFERGWARHLYSGTGELLGLMVGLADGPALPFGLHAMRIESMCRLATLALEQSNLIEELAFEGNHDTLTRLFNRSHYEPALAWTLREGRRTERSTALLYANLDRFRQVNEVLGIAVGNRLLAEAGRRFQTCLREGDMLARVGGDEFAVVLPELAALDTAGAVAGRMLRALSRPFSIDGHELFLSASIGIGYSRPESTPAALEREAYIALYQAKQAGKARAMFFDPSMAATPPERLEMEKRLRFAIARGEMMLYYQPQVELASGRVTGCEALLRWRPEGLGMVSPATFIPILEETGRITEIGRWVLGEACRQGTLWAREGAAPLRIGVNVSALEVAQPDFAAEVERALSETGFAPEQLELELTESLFVGEFGPARRIFQDLRRTGIRFALDDFGTGQSSLSYLDKLPFDRLKIDQSFIRPIRGGEECPPLARNIVRMAESLGISTIAEGIETAHQSGLLRSLGCIEGQGYYFSPPLAAGPFSEFRKTFRAR